MPAQTPLWIRLHAIGTIYQPIARNALLQPQVLCIESVHTGNVKEDYSRALCHAKPSPSSLISLCKGHSCPGWTQQEYHG